MEDRRRSARPLVVAWGGLDPGGEAGLAADVLAAHAVGAVARLVLTARTAQGDGCWRGAWPVAPDEVCAVADGLDLGGQVAAIKTGMLASVGNGRECLAFRAQRLPDAPLVVDPLCRSSSGGWLWPGSAEPEVLAFLRNELLPAAVAVTPNWPELAWLAGVPTLDGPEAAESALRRLPCAAVLKGGHAPAMWLGVDWVWDGRSLEPLPPASDWPGPVRGTGCRFATAMAAALARGATLREATETARAHVLADARVRRPGLQP